MGVEVEKLLSASLLWLLMAALRGKQVGCSRAAGAAALAGSRLGGDLRPLCCCRCCRWVP